VSAGNN